MTKTKTAAKKPIRKETVEMTEAAAFALYKELLEEVFKQGGITGLALAGGALLKEVDNYASECERQGMDVRTTKGIVSAYLLTEWLPGMIEGTVNCPRDDR